jgi:ADYC domain
MKNKAIILRSMPAVLLLGAASAIAGACQPPREEAKQMGQSNDAPAGSSSSTPPRFGAVLPGVASTTNSPVPQALDCSRPLGIEEGGPQSRMYKGGCLQQFSYFYVPGGESRVDVLPPAAVGIHVKLGDTAPYDVGLARSGEIKIRSRNEPIPLYQATVVTPQGKVNLCDKQRGGASSSEPDELEGKAIAVPGFWERERKKQIYEVSGRKVFSLSCASGVVAKCIKWGYQPSETDAGQQDLYSACLHAARGQFTLEDNKSYTCDGTEIYLFNRKEKVDVPPGFIFEAAWGKDGILCMDRPRFTCCKFPTRSCDTKERRDWPEGVLIKTYSKENKGACPSSSEECK